MSVRPTCVKYGTLTPTTSGVSVSLSGLGISSVNDYVVIIDSGASRLSGQDSGYGSAAYLSAKTDSSFSIATTSVGIGTPAPPVSYQVIAGVNCILYGTGYGTKTISGVSSANDYMVILDTGAGRASGQDSGYGQAAYISAKTATSFTISYNTYSASVSYQVIKFS